MHGVIVVNDEKLDRTAAALGLNRKLIGHAPVTTPASFAKGRGWFVAVASPQKMHWSTRERIASLGVTIKISKFTAEHELLDLGFECFAPTERRTKIHRGRRSERITPLFGNYVFIRFDREADNWETFIDPEDPWAAVHDILRVNDIPVRIPDIVIERLTRAEQAGAFDYANAKSPFAENDLVEIMEGPFAGLIARIKSARPRKRAKLLLDALGEMDIDPCFLRKME